MTIPALPAGTGAVHSAAIPTSDLYAADPALRLRAAKALSGRSRRSLLRDAAGQWPPFSPGVANPWLLMITAKPPSWRDPLLKWNELPPTLGEPHEGFFYPDPLGFWAEVRRWAAILVRHVAPGTSLADVLSVAALLQAGEGTRPAGVISRCRPSVLLFLDEASVQAAGDTQTGDPHSIPDPHRPGTVYEGWWSRHPGGTVIGKAPQHPAAHNFYRSADMDRFLRAAPTVAG